METFDIVYADRKSRHKKKFVPQIDMTPMVDLGFLLITFFIVTTTMSQPSTTKLIMPADPGKSIPPMKLQDELALTLLLGNNDKVYYYHGNWNDALKTNSIGTTNYSYSEGVGSIIREKQRTIEASKKFTGGRNEMMVIIKPGKEASYQNTIDALDEMLINNVKKYAIVDLSKEEMEFIESRSLK